MVGTHCVLMLSCLPTKLTKDKFEKTTDELGLGGDEGGGTVVGA